MSRRFISLLIFIAVLPFAFAFKSASVTTKKGVQTIIIDPGHGGKDQGAKGAFTTEAKICLSVGLKLGKAIEERFPGVKIPTPEQLMFFLVISQIKTRLFVTGLNLPINQG